MDLEPPTLELGEDEYLKGVECHQRNQLPPAMAYYEASSKLGFPPANLMLGSIYKLSSVGIRKDPIKSKFYLDKIANHFQYFENRTKSNDSTDLFNFGRCYDICVFFGEQNYEMAVKYYKLAADQGNPFAQSNLGFLYSFGFGGVKDEQLAVKYYQLAANQDYAPAQHNLGVNYDGGKGVPKDHAIAAQYYKKAADHGHANAQYNLGICYKNGEGVPIDLSLAIKYYTLSADQGFASAQNNLGVCYKSGDGVKKDWKIATDYYRLAADQGDSNGQYNLGMCFLEEQGVDLDLVEAAKYLQLSADQGNSRALRSLWNEKFFESEFSLLEKGYRVGSRSACYETRDVCMVILLGMNGATLLPELWTIVVTSLLHSQAMRE